MLPSLPATSAAEGERSRDEQLTRLFEGHFDFIWRLLRRVGLSRADADDASQQVFMTLTQKLEQIQPGRERTYLYGVALRIAANWKRKQKRRREDDAPMAEPLDPALPPDEAAALAEARSTLDALLAELPDELRRVIVMAEIGQIEVAQIAAVEGLPLGTAASRLRRARALLEAGLTRLRARRAAGGVR
jgi:RNA polymerase sigma-70 factor (ECF subfamily)